jgi:predicted nucleotidyltransferase
MSRIADLEQMLIMVAGALGEELLQQVAFVGGCTTGLLITDKVTQEAIRYTDDVDFITHVIGYPQWAAFQQQLFDHGFTVNPKDDVICRMRLGELKVDFMPDDASILGFSNRWYADALENADDVTLSDGQQIQLVSPCFFVATKLEAYNGRGNNDLLSSHDIEDLLNVVDGREELLNEIQQAEQVLKDYIAEQIGLLMGHNDIDYAVQACTHNNTDREVIIFKRLEALAKLGNGQN